MQIQEKRPGGVIVRPEKSGQLEKTTATKKTEQQSSL